MALIPSPLTMTEEEFELFNEYLIHRFGLHFPVHKKEILESRLAPRLRALQLHRFMDYYLLLQYAGDSELHRLASLVTNNESYFFREIHQFESLFTRTFEDFKFHAANRETLRFLCAGCSSGEEPYTLNIFRTFIDEIDVQRDDWDWMLQAAIDDAGVTTDPCHSLSVLAQEFLNFRPTR